jgi:hypothetical protein
MLEPFKDGIINPSAHSMENYVSSVKGTAWSGLRSGAVDIDWSERSKKWLESASSEGTLMFGVKSLWMIKQALDWLLKKVMVGVVGTAMAVSCTFIDQLAWLLHQGAQAAIETGEYVESLIARIMQFLGRTVVVGQRLTVAFIRWVLSSLGSALYNIASRSLSMLNIR